VTCAELKELIGAYALGALDPIERAAVEAHLAEPTHDGCQEALASAEEAASLLAAALPPFLPTKGVWQGIERRIGAPQRNRWSEAFAWTAAAAAVLILVWVLKDRDRVQGEVAANVQQAKTADDARARCVADLDKTKANERLQRDALELLQKPSSRLIALAPQAGETSHASVILGTTEQRAFVVGSGLSAPSGKDYELWIIRGDKPPIPAGVLRSDPTTGGLLAAIDPKLLEGGQPDAIAVTLEPAGGSTTPTLPIRLVGKI
jgi:anti-sigma-K factor RskA